MVYLPRPPGHGPNFDIKREEIVDTAAALFAKRGYAATGILEICAATGLAKGALYYYISSKENLLVEVQSRVLTPLLAMSRRIASIDADPVVRLRLISEALMRMIFERLDHIVIYEHDYRYLSSHNRERFKQQRRDFEKIILDQFIEAMELGLFRAMDARLGTLQFLNLHNHTYQWARPDGRWTPSDLSREYCRTLVLGFGSSGRDISHVEGAVEQQLLDHPDLINHARYAHATAAVAT